MLSAVLLHAQLEAGLWENSAVSYFTMVYRRSEIVRERCETRDLEIFD